MNGPIRAMLSSSRASGVGILAAGLMATGLGCGSQGEGGSGEGDISVERLPEVQPNLPSVPTLPPPPFPTQYSDSSYSVYGLRHRMRNTMDTDVEVTGYIVEIYQPPECAEDDHCPPTAAPHMWVADTPEEPDRQKRLQVVGYAENHLQIEEAIDDAQHGRTQEDLPDGMIPIPTDFAVGAKVKVSGRFTRVSGAGFNISEGLLDYRGHEILEPPPGGDEET